MKNETLAALAAEFLALQQRTVSAQGHKALSALIRALCHWLEEEELDPLDIGISDAVRYLAVLGERVSERGKPYAVGTIHNRLKAARKFFAYLVRTERRTTNPFSEVEYPRLEDRVSRNVLSEAQMGRLLSDLGKFHERKGARAQHRAYRVHVIAEFLYATGLRIDEACHLEERDLDLEHRLVHVRKGKGGVPRTAFLTAYGTAVMEHYLKSGREAVLRRGQNDGSLFGAATSRMVVFVNEELRNCCRVLGLPGITTHGFRHSLGTHLLRSGCDMRHIQVILGHEALATTQIYTRVEREDLKKSLDEFHPRKWNARRDPDER